MKKTAIVSLFLLVALLISLTAATSASALEAPELSAPNIVLAELESGEIFYAQNETQKIYPASLTKIMTVLLAVEAIERGDTTLDTPVMAGSDLGYDLEADGSTAGITAGEVLSLETLMQCALVASANEACNVIAEHISGSHEAFIDLMNERAAQLGCSGTHFANTHGLPNEDHYTTAWDMYLISREAVSHEVFARICSMTEVTIPGSSGAPDRTYKNTNALLGDNNSYKGYTYEGACGVKTGHTGAAGYCLVAMAKRDGFTLLSVVMGAKAYNNNDGTLDVKSFADTRTLFDWAFDNFSYQTLLRTNETVDKLPVEMGDEETVSVRPQTAIQALLPNDTDLADCKREMTYTYAENGGTLNAPLEEGTVLGEITVSLNGRVYGSTSLVVSKSVSLSRSQYVRSRISAFFHNKIVITVIVVLIVLILLYIFLVVRYNIRRKRHLRSVAAAKRERDRRAAAAAAAAKAKAEEEARVRAFRPDDPVWPEEQAPKAGAPEKPAERDYFEEFFK